MKKIFSVFMIAIFGFTLDMSPMVASAEDGGGGDAKSLFTDEEANLTDGFLNMFDEMPMVKTLLLKVVYGILYFTFFVAIVTALLRGYKAVKGEVDEGALFFVAKPILWWLSMFFLLFIINAGFKLMQSV